MKIADELERLEDLFQRGRLTNDEFAAAKAAVLAGQEVDFHFDSIEPKNEIARLDREWALERRRYLIILRGRFGERKIRKRGTSAIGGIVIAVLGIYWSISGALMGAPFFHLLFGMTFILVGLAMSLYSFVNAHRYQRAFQRYQKRRALLLAQIKEEPS
jgi:hypothetical protein